MRIEAQGNYMQSILEKAYQTLAGEGAMTATGSYKDLQTQATMNLGAMAFPSLHDLHLFNNDQLEMSQQLDRPLDDFFPSNETLCLGKKRPNPYSYSNGKNPVLWSEELKLQEFGAQEESSKNNDIDHEHLQIAPSVNNGGMEMESVANHFYEAKPLLSADCSGEKYGGSLKLDTPTTPRRTSISTPERMSPMIRGGSLGQTRNLSYA